MLAALHISNYALIDSAEIDFQKGFTTITGETGAGKSILLGALGLLLGDRSDSGVLFDKKKKCIVEGRFAIKTNAIEKLCQENDLDYTDEILIRREVTAEGKSRAFVNDTPVSLSFLKQLGAMLVDVHSQHETLTLGNSRFQLSVLDAVSGTGNLLQQYSEQFSAYKKVLAKTEELRELELRAKKDLDYYTFQFEELQVLDLKDNEIEALEAEQGTLENAEAIKSGLSKSVYALHAAEENLIDGLIDVRNTLQQLAKYNPKVAVLTERLNSTVIELKDIAAETGILEEEIVYDPQRIEWILQRLNAIYRLQHKHGLKSTAELITLCNELEEKIAAINSVDVQLAEAEEETERLLKSLRETGAQLTEKRKAAAASFSKKVKELLSSLGMASAQLSVEFEQLEEPKDSGFDKVTFLFNANKGAELQPLNKVASGGELSRLMLSLKAMLSKSASLPTIIFDEIDTGISGDIAAKAGNIMKEMGKDMQVITITHLPQVAGKGHSHLHVYKAERAGKTVSKIRTLNEAERVEEIAKMLSAGKPGEAAMENARELMVME